MGLFERVRELFGKPAGPYEKAQKERVEAVRKAVPDGSPTLDYLLAMVALVSDAEEKKVGADSRLLEDLEFGDLEYMEIELLCEDLFGVEIPGSELNLAESLGDLARMIDRLRGVESKAPESEKTDVAEENDGESEDAGPEASGGIVSGPDA